MLIPFKQFKEFYYPEADKLQNNIREYCSKIENNTAYYTPNDDLVDMTARQWVAQNIYRYAFAFSGDDEDGSFDLERLAKEVTLMLVACTQDTDLRAGGARQLLAIYRVRELGRSVDLRWSNTNPATMALRRAYHVADSARREEENRAAMWRITKGKGTMYLAWNKKWTRDPARAMEWPFDQRPELQDGWRYERVS